MIQYIDGVAQLSEEWDYRKWLCLVSLYSAPLLLSLDLFSRGSRKGLPVIYRLCDWGPGLVLLGLFLYVRRLRKICSEFLPPLAGPWWSYHCLWGQYARRLYSCMNLLVLKKLLWSPPLSSQRLKLYRFSPHANNSVPRLTIVFPICLVSSLMKLFL